MKHWYTSKTIWLMGASLLITVLSEPTVVALIPLEYLPALQGVIAILGVILRFKTDKPVWL